jgi:hypothetical protein
MLAECLQSQVDSNARGKTTSMVRRGSTVRVRQRALQKPRKSRLFLLKELAEAPVWVGMELFMELSDPKDRSERLAFEREAGVSTRLHSSTTPIRCWP